MNTAKHMRRECCFIQFKGLEIEIRKTLKTEGTENLTVLSFVVASRTVKCVGRGMDILQKNLYMIESKTYAYIMCTEKDQGTN